MTRAPSSWLLALWLLGAPSGHAELYRWVDETGQTHFSDQPRDRPIHEIAVRPAPPRQPEPGARLEKTHRLLNAFEIERQRERERQAEQKRAAEERRGKCNRARDDLRQAGESGAVYRLDRDGNRIYLSAAERGALLEQHRKAIAAWCD